MSPHLAYLLWPILTGGTVVFQEVLFRKGIIWHDHLWLFVPLAVLVNYGVYRTVTGGSSLLLAIVAFSLATLTLRVLASQFILGEEVTKGNLVAVAALLVGVVAGNLWK